ncbi:MAG: hypothetical protein J7K73_02440 [Nanoarchaeota archaeon]|nr:hypothetical protein [Nanoarchaeota archaeon]
MADDDTREKIRAILARSFVNKYEMEIHSFTSSIEQYYFWLVDFLGKLGYKIEKDKEQMAASVVSQFFGEMSARRQHLERRGMEILATINTVIKSIVNLLYDLREFDRRLAVYKDLHSSDPKKREAARLTLKRIWMDEVDVRKGGASINAMTAQRGLEFTTLRDAFMIANSIEEVDKMDLNDRVKRILKGRLEEYFKWEKESEKELTQRRKIELAYLKSQVEALRLYSIWAKPYLKAAQMLSFKEPKIDDPQLIQAFDQSVIEIVIRGIKKYYLHDFLKPKGLPAKYSPPLMKKPLIPLLSEPKVYTSKEQAEMKAKRGGPYAYSIIELRFTWRTRPALVSQAQTGGAYRQLGKLNIEFIGYAMTPDEYKALRKQEEHEAMKFIEGLTTESLEAMREDLEKYLKEAELLEKKKEEKKFVPLLDRLSKKKSGSKGGLLDSLFSTNKILERKVKELVMIETADRLFTIYDIFKKAHRFKSFPYPPEMKPTEKSVIKPPEPVEF